MERYKSGDEEAIRLLLMRLEGKDETFFYTNFLKELLQSFGKVYPRQLEEMLRDSNSSTYLFAESMEDQKPDSIAILPQTKFREYDYFLRPITALDKTAFEKHLQKIYRIKYSEHLILLERETGILIVRPGSSTAKQLAAPHN